MIDLVFLSNKTTYWQSFKEREAMEKAASALYDERVNLGRYPVQWGYFCDPGALFKFVGDKVGLMICDYDCVYQLEKLVAHNGQAAWLKNVPLVVVTPASNVDEVSKMYIGLNIVGSINTVPENQLEDPKTYYHLLLALDIAERNENGVITKKAFQKAMSDCRDKAEKEFPDRPKRGLIYNILQKLQN